MFGLLINLTAISQKKLSIVFNLRDLPKLSRIDLWRFSRFINFNQSLRLLFKKIITWVQLDYEWFLLIVINSLDVNYGIDYAALVLINKLVNYISIFKNCALQGQAIKHYIHLTILVKITLRNGHRDLRFIFLG